MAVYAFALPSLQATHPALQNIDDIDDYPELGRSVAAGTPLDVTDIIAAKRAIFSLEGLLLTGNPAVTQAILESAHNRLGLLRDMHGTAEYGAGNLAVMIHQLTQVVQNGFNDMQNGFNGVCARLDSINARLDSTEVRIETGLRPSENSA